MKTILIIMCFLLGGLYISATSSATKKQNTVINGFFEGNEPFWDMEIKNNLIILHCVNDSLTDTLQFSQKQAQSDTYAFKGKNIFGLIRKSGTEGCELDITEEANPTHEIYFSYKNVTYMGCGHLTLKNELTSFSFNQNNLIKHSRWKTSLQTLRSKDAKMDTIIIIGPDEPLGYIPNIHFKDGKNLVMADERKITDYRYTIKDSVLTYWETDIPQNKEKFRIMTSTSDSLILSRTENWASGTLVLTGTVYLVPDKREF